MFLLSGHRFSSYNEAITAPTKRDAFAPAAVSTINSQLYNIIEPSCRVATPPNQPETPRDLGRLFWTRRECVRNGRSPRSGNYPLGHRKSGTRHCCRPYLHLDCCPLPGARLSRGQSGICCRTGNSQCSNTCGTSSFCTCAAESKPTSARPAWAN